MSKSLGNIERVHDLVRQHPPEALRLALLSAHYRQPLDWSDGLIEQSVRTLDRLYGTLRELASIEASAVIPASVEATLDDDLNTPQALAEVARIAADARRATDLAEQARLKGELLGAGLALGLLQADPAQWFGTAAGDDGDDARIQGLIDERAAAKKARDSPFRCHPRPAGRRRHRAGRHPAGRALVAQARLTCPAPWPARRPRPHCRDCCDRLPVPA